MAGLLSLGVSTVLAASVLLSPAAGEIDETRAGRQGGPGRTVTRVHAFSTDVFEVRFVGGQPAGVSIRGDGDTDLDLYVYDENGNLIGRSTGLSDREIVTWTPRWTGTFRIEVRNLGSVYNQYSLVTN
jgi:hypothetical protein